MHEDFSSVCLCHICCHLLAKASYVAKFGSLWEGATKGGSHRRGVSVASFR